jgi:TatD DNase family protein
MVCWPSSDGEETAVLIDTHCHLDASEFDADREQVLQAARAAGVERIVIPAVELSNFEQVRQLAHRNPGCVYALGIHPMYVDRARDEDLIHLRSWLQSCIDDPLLIAVGEIGLDFFVQGLDRPRQLRFYDAQLRLAREFDLPVLLHVRRSQDIVLKHLRLIRPQGGIAHAFNGSEQQAQAFVDLGFALGIGGAMTFERARQIRRLTATMPETALVLETDAPDIPPAWLSRSRNSPAELVQIAEEFAKLRGLTAEQVARLTTGNALRVLPRLAECQPD